MSEEVEQPQPWALNLTPAAPKGTFAQLELIFRTGYACAAKWENEPNEADPLKRGRFTFLMTPHDAMKLAKNVAGMVEQGLVVGPYPRNGTPDQALKPPPAAAVAASRWSVQSGGAAPAKPEPPPKVEPAAEPIFTRGNTPDALKVALSNLPELGPVQPMSNTHGIPVPPPAPPISAPLTGVDAPQVTVGVAATVSTPIETRLPPGPQQVAYPPGHVPVGPPPEAIEPQATGAHVSHLPIDGPTSAVVGPIAGFMGDLQAAGGMNMYVYARLQALRARRVTEKNHREWVKLGTMSERTYLIRQVADLTRHSGKCWLVERKYAPERELGRVNDWKAAVDLVETEERSLVTPTPADPATLPNSVEDLTEIEKFSLWEDELTAREKALDEREEQVLLREAQLREDIQAWSVITAGSRNEEVRLEEPAPQE